jgi:hypothetical protein
MSKQSFGIKLMEKFAYLDNLPSELAVSKEGVHLLMQREYQQVITMPEKHGLYWVNGIPICKFDSPDRGWIYFLMMDMLHPFASEFIYSENAKHFQTSGLKVIKEGRLDSLMDISGGWDTILSANKHGLKESLKRGKHLVTQPIDSLVARSFINQYWAAHLEHFKGEEYIPFGCPYDIFLNHPNASTRCLGIFDGHSMVAVAVLDVYYDECFWQDVVQIRNPNYDKLGLGNFVIWSIIKWCIEQNIVNLNMGMAFYSYKQNWANITDVWSSGLEVAGELKLIDYKPQSVK